MTAKRLLKIGIALGLLAATSSGLYAGSPLGSAFTYQGQLKQAGEVLSGTADFQFSLWDAAQTGNQIGTTVTVDAASVTEGLFTVELDFGVAAFDGDARWLEVAVRSPAGSGDYTTLTPRQPLTAAPYSLQTRGLYVDAEGKVGIGTTVPAGPLTVVDSPSPSGETTLVIDNLGGSTGDSDRISFRHDGYEQAYIESYLNGGWPTDLVFGMATGQGTGLAERLRIMSSGLVLCSGPSAGVNVVNPDNASAGVALSWRDNVARIRVGGTGLGSDSGLDIQGPGNTSLLRVNGDGTIRTRAVTITGADLAEKFPVTDEVQPGMVVAIDPTNPGQLRLAEGTYNRCVAGIVSGANGLPAGAVMGNLPGSDDAPPIALSGRVWCFCDTSNGAIQPGDLLTTASAPGHAMKVTDYAKAQGAVLGKAMTSLEQGRGLVLVLVSLQ